ncbi:adenosylcobinamide-phosphate synthase CbiB [Acidocella facilis]|uniref:adenosylcobinamide-phosphate synthase CbiB n=1 Tax=Acidocella facilis TaxID=525 RepID=UPI00047B2F03|nr:adenosylcobinamide-phosphate synthase CbiB [Acidocella facilis]
MTLHPLAMALALGLDAAIGWPDAVFRAIGHPVTWCGALISALEARLNQGPARRLKGVATALLVIAIAIFFGVALQALSGTLLTALLAWPLLAARSLHEHVARVAKPLAAQDLPAARQAVSMIVGRDPERLNARGIARAALESLAENSSDGIIAPLFWGALFGLPGIAAYKAINTLDSMLGHRTPRYEAFGWASARIDDLANLLPARLTALLFIITAPNRAAAWIVTSNDARHHRSPNGGWPEAAMAGALGLRLSGPRIYGNEAANEPWINANGRDPGPEDIYAALALYRRALILAAALLGLSAVLAPQALGLMR